jgi:hypothetical protein
LKNGVNNYILEASLNKGTDSVAKSHDGLHINTLNAELNPICHLLALLGAHTIFHVSRIRVNFNTVDKGKDT